MNGRLVALPIFTDAPALYYRTDLLEKYSLEPPQTWDELEAAAQTIQDGDDLLGGIQVAVANQGNPFEMRLDFGNAIPAGLAGSRSRSSQRRSVMSWSLVVSFRPAGLSRLTARESRAGATGLGVT